MSCFLQCLRLTCLALAGGVLGAFCSVVMARILGSHFFVDVRPFVDGAVGIWKSLGLPAPFLGQAFTVGAAAAGFITGALLVLFPFLGRGRPPRTER